MKRVLVISYVPPYNRQGYDLASCLRGAGHKVCLLQMNGVSIPSKGVVGVKCYKPQGAFHKLIMVVNFVKFAVCSFFRQKQIVVCVGKPMLPLGGIYHFLFGSKLVWYSLEYLKLGRIERFVYRHCVSGYIDVEENRMKAIFTEYGEKKNALVCHNMPPLHEMPVKGGALRKYLQEKFGDVADKRLVIYAGSYQEYACLDRIIDASKGFDEDVRLILMAYGLPKEMQSLSHKCIVVPPVGGDGFYDWLADADCALLPYEDEADFNVRNCSPQKLFDCYVVGVPYVASDRPIVRVVMGRYKMAGVLCTFSTASEIHDKINEAIRLKTLAGDAMRRLHIEEFNYNRMAGGVERLVANL